MMGGRAMGGGVELCAEVCGHGRFGVGRVGVVAADDGVERGAQGDELALGFADAGEGGVVGGAGFAVADGDLDAGQGAVRMFEVGADGEMFERGPTLA
jgi:hypothetical protein